MKIESRNEQETFELGRRLGRRLHPPRTILLQGSLGTGKTVLTRGLVAGRGGNPDQVASPTFTLVNQYPTPGGILYHLDLHRLDTLKDLYSIGIEDILASDSVVVVEWAEKLRLPVDHPLRIRIRADGNRRRFELDPPVDLAK